MIMNLRQKKKLWSIFFKLKDSECDKESIFNKGVRHISKELQKKIDKQAEEYINRVYFEKEKEE